MTKAAQPARDSSSIPKSYSGKLEKKSASKKIKASKASPAVAAKTAANDNVTAPAAEWMDPRTLKPWPDNPRAVDSKDITRVARSIEKFGFGAPIVVRRENLEIIAGHVRHLASLQLDLERVPVRMLEVSEAGAHALAIADNRYVELVSWKPELSDILNSFETDMRELTGWSDKEIGRLQEHLIGSGTSKEINADDLVNESFAHKCPQCGCEFNDS